MFGPIGMPELIIIFIIALIVFGPRKLPELGKSLGKSLAEFKRASNDLRNSLEEEIRIEERHKEPQTGESPPNRWSAGTGIEAAAPAEEATKGGEEAPSGPDGPPLPMGEEAKHPS